MINLRSLPLCVLASVLVSPLSSLAQQAAPAVRIVNPVNESQRITLTHTVNPLANAANDRGAAPDGMQLDRLQLVLQRSPAQETALRQFIAEENTPGSPSYHQWLTPQQFGTQFGASDQDIATVESWLGSHGFAISRVNPGKGTLEFSGSVAQLRDAFHTQIHRYAVDGETHYANANDPQIPAALAPAIAGFTSLNNFRPRSYLQKLGRSLLQSRHAPGFAVDVGHQLQRVLRPRARRLRHAVRSRSALCRQRQRHRPDHRHHQRVQHQHRSRQSVPHALRPARQPAPGHHRRQRSRHRRRQQPRRPQLRFLRGLSRCRSRPAR